MHLFGYGTNHTDFEQIQILQKVAPFLGGDNMFKRYVFGDGKWLLVNGYSITYFEEPLTREDLSTTVSSPYFLFAALSRPRRLMMRVGVGAHMVRRLPARARGSSRRPRTSRTRPSEANVLHRESESFQPPFFSLSRCLPRPDSPSSSLLLQDDIVGPVLNGRFSQSLSELTRVCNVAGNNVISECRVHLSPSGRVGRRP